MSISGIREGVFTLGVGEENFEACLGVLPRQIRTNSKSLGKMCLERLIDHVINDWSRGVEGAGLLTGSGLGLFVVRGEEVLEDFA